MTSPCKEAVASSDSVAFPLFTVKAQLQGVQAIVEDLGSTLEDPETEVAALIAALPSDVSAPEHRDTPLLDLLTAGDELKEQLRTGYGLLFERLEACRQRGPDEQEPEVRQLEFSVLLEWMDRYEHAMAALSEYECRSGQRDLMARVARAAGIEMPEPLPLDFGLD